MVAHHMESHDYEKDWNRDVGSAVGGSPSPTPTHEAPVDLEIPDGGREAWIVVLGASLAVLVASGMINAYVRRDVLPSCVNM